VSASVELAGVTKRYGAVTAVDGVGLTVAAGKRLALLGHNGAGKTTVLKMLLGLVRPDQGSVRVLGQEPGDARSPLRRAVGFLPEAVAFDAAMTGWETIGFYARLKGRPQRECRELMERVGLAAAAGRRVSTYSKGMRQRLGLAQALLGGPRVLLLDEPTSGLDPELRQAFYAAMSDLAADGAAVVLSSHLLTELEERTDLIAIMDRGRLVAAGTLSDLRVRAKLPLTLRLLVAPGRAGAVAAALAPVRVVAEGIDRLVLRCPAADKLAILRRVVALDDLQDVAVAEPSLDDVYAHFVSREEDRR
jgi:Cu-processing system ATP-binding protein